MATSSTTTNNLLLLLSPHSHAHPPPPPQPPPWYVHSTLSPKRHVTTTSVLSLRPSWNNVLVVCASKSDSSSNFGFDNDDDGEQLAGKSRSGRRRRRSSKRRWWSGEEEYYSSVVDQPKVGSLWDQIVDNLLILKALRSYGWFSPIIMLSLLLATGPKAFFMAFSLLLGVSLAIFVYNKLLEQLEGISKPRRRRRRTRAPFSRVEETATEEDDFDPGNGYQKRVYQSRVARKSGSMNGGVTEGTSNGNFGGWDELLGEEEINRTLYQLIEKQEVPQQKESSTMSLRDEKLPLLLRLLVAVFPFLESWTNFP